MKKYIKHNFLWVVLIALSFSSSIFLITEFQSSQPLAASTVSENPIHQKKVIIDDEEYESKDFHIFKNITEVINELLFF